MAASGPDVNTNIHDDMSASASQSVATLPEVCLPSASTAPLQQDAETTVLIGGISGNVQVDLSVTEGSRTTGFDYNTCFFLCMKATSWIAGKPWL